MNVFHDDRIGNKEKKFIHADGREAIYDGDTGKLITDPRYAGTYNYTNARDSERKLETFNDYADYLIASMEHGVYDVVPYLLLGNTREGVDAPLTVEEIRKNLGLPW